LAEAQWQRLQGLEEELKLAQQQWVLAVEAPVVEWLLALVVTLGQAEAPPSLVAVVSMLVAEVASNSSSAPEQAEPRQAQHLMERVLAPQSPVEPVAQAEVERALRRMEQLTVRCGAKVSWKDTLLEAPHTKTR